MQLIGLCRLGADVEVRYASNGEAVCTLNLAYNYGKKGDDGSRPTQWIRASLWGKRAESLAPYLLKGTAIVAVIGDVNVRTYEGKNGQGVSLEGRILELEFAGSRLEHEEQPPRPAARPSQANRQTSSRSDVEDLDDDIPF